MRDIDLEAKTTQIEQKKNDNLDDISKTFDQAAYGMSASETAAEAARELAEGVTVGLSRPVEAGIMAAKEKLFDESDKDLYDLYQKYKQLGKEREEKFEQESPILHGLTKYGGMAIPAVLTGGESIAAQAGIGAGLGGLEAATSSEAPITSPEFAKDVAKGTAMGGVFGTAGGLVGKAIPKIGGRIAKYFEEKATTSPMIQRAKVGFESAKAGKAFGGEDITGKLPIEATGGARTRALVDNASNEVADTLANSREILSKKIGDSLNPDLKINPLQELDSADRLLQEQLAKNKHLINDPDFQNFKNRIDFYKDQLSELGDFNAPEIHKIAKEFGDMADKEFQGTQFSAQAKELKRTLQNKISELDPNYKQNVVNLAKISEELPEKFTSKELVKYKNPKEEIQAGISNAMNEVHAGTGKQAEEAKRTLRDFYLNLRKLQTEKPELFKEIGLEDIFEKLKKLEDATAEDVVRRRFQGGDFKATGTVSYSAGRALLEKITSGAPIIAGHGARMTQKALPSPKTIGAFEAMRHGKGVAEESAKERELEPFSQSLDTASPDQLNQYASKLQQSDAYQHIGKSLQDAIDNNDSFKKNQMIFLLKQDSGAKKFLQEE